jgi:hypothetical protein
MCITQCYANCPLTGSASTGLRSCSPDCHLPKVNWQNVCGTRTWDTHHHTVIFAVGYAIGETSRVRTGVCTLVPAKLGANILSQSLGRPYRDRVWQAYICNGVLCRPQAVPHYQTKVWQCRRTPRYRTVRPPRYGTLKRSHSCAVCTVQPSSCSPAGEEFHTWADATGLT